MMNSSSRTTTTASPSPPPPPPPPQSPQKQESSDYHHHHSTLTEEKDTPAVQQPQEQEHVVVTSSHHVNNQDQTTTTSTVPRSVENNIIRVEIATTSSTTIADTTAAASSNFFYVPVSLMLTREIEMQEAARNNKIGRERWTSSRLFRMWKRQTKTTLMMKEQTIQGQQQQQQQQQPQRRQDGEMVVQMTPEVSLQNSTRGHQFRWKAWLTTCIRAYYNTGTLRVPDECMGDDLLMALEYFGILMASPDMFTFESQHAFDRIQAWSRYFTYRTELAENLLEAYDEAEAEDDNDEEDVSHDGDDENGEIDGDKARKLFLGSFSKVRIWVLFEEEGAFPTSDGQNNGKGNVLHVDGISAGRLTVRAHGGLYCLFAGIPKIDNFTTERLRLDFCEYVGQSLPPRTVMRFSMEKVQRSSGSESLEHFLPVIRIEPLKGDVQAHFGGIMKQATSTSVGSIGNGGKSLVASKLVSTECDSKYKEAMSEDAECHTNYSHHTKTLAGEGISPCTADVSGHGALRRTIALIDKQMHQQPDLTDDRKAPTNPGIQVQLAPRKYENPLSRSASVGICYQNSGLQDNAAVRCEETKTEKICQNQMDQAPIDYINTDLGDLRSVTSILSEPAVHYPPVAHLNATNANIANARDIVKQTAFSRGSEQKIPSNNLEAARNALESESAKEENKMQQAKAVAFALSDSEIICTPPRPNRHLEGSAPWSGDKNDGINFSQTREVRQDEGNNQENNSDSQDRNGPLELKSDSVSTDVFGSWGHILASMCEAVIPVAPSNETSSSSPIRMVRVNTTMKDGPPAPSLDSDQAEHDQPFVGCPCRQEESAAFADGETSEWVPQPESDLGQKSKTEPSNKTNPDEFNPDEFLDLARQLGKNLSSQFGEFFTMVTHETGEVKNYSGANSRGCLAPIPEEVPGIILPLPADEQTSVSMSMGSSNARRMKKKRTDKAPKARPKTIVAKSPTHDVSYSVPKSQSFDSDPLAETVVAMPPHPKARNSRDNKIAVTRRKPLAQPAVLQRDFQYEMSSDLPKVYALAEDKAPSVSSLSESSHNRGQGHHNYPPHRTMLT